MARTHVGMARHLGYSAHLGHHVAPDRAVAVDVETGHLRAYPAGVTGLAQLQAAAGLLVIWSSLPSGDEWAYEPAAGVSNAGAVAALEKRKRSQWMSGCDTNISSEIFMNKHLLGETGYWRDIQMDTPAAKHRLVVG